MTGVWQRHASIAAFWLAIVAVAAVQLAVVVPGVFTMRLWEDEAFNLTVPLNLVSGLGYTSDGTLSGSQLSTFDQRISTGPVVLLPIAVVLLLGADPVIGGRLVTLCFYIGLLVGLWLLGKRIGGPGAVGRWAGLASICVPLGWNTWSSGSPIQSPVDILGEVPSAALVVWALIVMRRRPWLAGLLVGLAMQAKLISALSAPAVALGVLLVIAGTFWGRVWRVVVCGLFALIPNVLYELWKLITLGPAAYVSNLREFYWFFKTGGQHIAPVPPLQKLDAIIGTWFSPLWLTALALAVFIVVAVCVVVLVARSSNGTFSEWRAGREMWQKERWVLATIGAFGMLTWALWWMLSRGTPTWPRHPTPGIYVFAPLLAATFVAGIARLWRQIPGQAVARVGVAAASLVLVAALSTQLWGRLQVADESRFGEDLADQRAAAAAIAELGEPQLVSAWGPEVSIIVLSGAHAGLTDVPELVGTPQVWRKDDASKAGETTFADRLEQACTDVPVHVAAYAVCVPRE